MGGTVAKWFEHERWTPELAVRVQPLVWAPHCFLWQDTFLSACHSPGVARCGYRRINAGGNAAMD